MIKFSKLFLLAAASLSFFGSCSDDDTIIYPEPEFGDYVSVNPESASISSKGGQASVMVTSNGEWTLAGESAYVTPSATQGKDGEVVTFTVNPNDKHEDQVFKYEFKNGQKTASYTITLLRKALDELTLNFAEGSNNVAYTGGEVKVIVVSNNAWTLEGTSDFATPSVTEGTDGDEVVFAVKANETDAERAAKFQFKNGEKVVDFEIKQAAYVETIELTKTDVKLSNKANKKYEVAVKTNVNNRELKAEIPAEANWVSFKGALDAAEGATAILDIQANRTTEARTAAITFKGPKGATAVLNLTQMPEVVLSVSAKAFMVKMDATAYEVPVTANVEYDVTVSAEGNGWFTFNSVTAENVLKFDVKPLEGETPRACKVTLTEKNPAEDVKAAVVEFAIEQKPAGLINCAADMRQSRTHFPSMVNSQALNVASWSMEALVNIQEARTRGTLSTIMGIEGIALLRMGDASLPWNQLQVVADGESSVTGKESQLNELNRWYHIAFTYNYDNKTAKLYIDGELKLTETRWYRTTNFAKPYTGSESWSRSFWIGYSYSSDRYFPGFMSEMRLWNRELSEQEIKSPNHFYQVDPNSEGLVGYWKLNDGKGYIVKDYSKSGNNMEGEINVRHHREDDSHRGEPGMNWVDVNIG